MNVELKLSEKVVSTTGRTRVEYDGNHIYIVDPTLGHLLVPDTIVLERLLTAARGLVADHRHMMKKIDGGEHE